MAFRADNQSEVLLVESLTGGDFTESCDVLVPHKTTTSQTSQFSFSLIWFSVICVTLDRIVVCHFRSVLCYHFLH